MRIFHVLGFVLLALATLRGEAPPLHPQAIVESNLEGAQEGKLPLSFQAASTAWSSRLRAAGWVLEQRSDLPGKSPAHLSVWAKKDRRYSLLLISESTGSTRFLLFPHPQTP